MFYPKPKLNKKVTNAKITFTNFENTMDTEVDEALLPYKTAKMSYNFNVKNGALKNGYGFKDLCLPGWQKEGERQILPPSSPVKKIWHYKTYDHEDKTDYDEMLFFCENGDLYSCLIKSDSPFLVKIKEGFDASSIPNAINYRLDSVDTFILSSQSDGMWKYIHNRAITKVEDAPYIKSMCLHYERLFAVAGEERNRLAYSANLDPTNWNEDLSSGGFIEMQDERGALNKVISFNDYVYIFRDFGVARLSAYGDQTEFSVSQLFKSSVKLYGDTVTLCGNKVLLLARDGIHTFDGYSTSKLNLGIDKLFEGVENDKAVGLYYHNKFFLACKLNFNDGEKIGCENYENGYINNALIVYDLSTNELSITRGVDICSMQAVDYENFTKVIACFNGEYSSRLGELTNDGCIFEKVLPKKWVSPKSNMGYPTKVKHIKECLIKSKTPCKVYILTDKQKKEFFVDGKETSQRIKLNTYGEQIEVGFEVTEKGDTNISCPQIIVGITN